MIGLLNSKIGVRFLIIASGCHSIPENANYLGRHTSANSGDPDQTDQTATEMEQSDLGLHCLEICLQSQCRLQIY